MKDSGALTRAERELIDNLDRFIDYHTAISSKKVETIRLSKWQWNIWLGIKRKASTYAQHSYSTKIIDGKYRGIEILK